ncbi:MAG: translation initiation factor IF-2 N-terminal domain-containing protein, partial [Syntrophales bacterium]|nr:translation initiation factor IF-2 N-terminal domain-containing protein [Syntrophales bacterium]
MPKKRVYELAKDLGLENGEIISRLERLGVAVKSHSSTIEDSEVQRIKEELSAGETLEVVEERIKSTVIRRRAVRHHIDEIKTEAPEEVIPVEPEKEKVEKTAEQLTLSELAAKGERETLREETTIPERKEEESKPEVPIPISEPISPPSHPTPIPTPAPVSVTAKKEYPARTERKKDFPVHIPKKAEPEIKKEIPKEPKFAVPKGAIPHEGEKPAKRKEVQSKRPWKKPVEVLIKDQLPVRKKPFLKRIGGKKPGTLQTEMAEERVARRREEERKAPPPVKMKKTIITVPKAIKRRIKVGEAISVADLARKMAVKAS